MPPMSNATRLVIGTAGHIDHGKSRLVHALTGDDPDRLPEEKARGMTIDLGFAYTRLEEADIYFVDVPGHERFLRNMLAGASGIDAALLVVAADDSVMPQTREHAEILALLDVQRCLVAITKMDLVDEEWADQVEEEVRELLGELGLTPQEVIRTSAETDQGLDALRAALVRTARAPATRDDAYCWFRLPVDRSFVIAGRGTVATGTAAHGAVAAGDELVLWPPGRRVRVRGLQTHHDAHDRLAGRQRIAVNLAGVDQQEVERGCLLLTPDYLEPTRLLEGWLAWLRIPGRLPRQTLRCRLHMGTREVRVQLRLLTPAETPLVRMPYVQLRTEHEICAAWGDRFILRDESDRQTLGGGVMLRPVARTWTRKRPGVAEGLEALRTGPPRARLEEVVRDAEWQPLSPRALSVRAGLPDEPAAAALARDLASAGRLRHLRDGATAVYLHSMHVAALAEDLDRRLQRYLADNPRRPGVPPAQWPGWMPTALPARLRPVLAQWLIDHGAVSLRHEHIAPLDAAPAISPEDEKLLAALLSQFEQAACQPPTWDDLRPTDAKQEQRLRQLIDLAVAQGDLIRITSEMWLHRRWWDDLRTQVTEAIRARGPLPMSELRTLMNSSRKYAVPIAEQLDAAGITKRLGDRRTLGPRAVQ